MRSRLVPLIDLVVVATGAVLLATGSGPPSRSPAFSSWRAPSARSPSTATSAATPRTTPAPSPAAKLYAPWPPTIPTARWSRLAGAQCPTAAIKPQFTDEVAGAVAGMVVGRDRMEGA